MYGASVFVVDIKGIQLLKMIMDKFDKSLEWIDTLEVHQKFHGAGVLLFLVGLFMLPKASEGDLPWARWASYLTLALFGIGTAVHLSGWWARFWNRKWLRWTYAGTSGIFGFVANILARNLVAAWTGLPPQDLSTAVIVATAIATFLIALFLLMAFLVLFAVISSLAGSLASRTAKVFFFADAVGAYALAAGLASLMFGLFGKEERLRDVVTFSAFIGDYQEAAKYPDVAGLGRVHFHGDGVVSRTWIENGKVEFKAWRIQKEPPPGPGALWATAQAAGRR